MTRAGRYGVSAVGVLAVTGGLLATVVAMTAPLDTSQQRTRVSEFLYFCNPLLLGTLGTYLALRRSRHPAGWLMLAAALGVATGSLGQAVYAHGGPPVLLPWAVWVENWTWVVLLGVLPVMLLRFPDGRLASSRWRIPSAAAVCAGAVCIVVEAAERTDPGYPGIVMPVDLGPVSRLSPSTMGATVFAAFFVMVAVLAASLVSLGLRFHRASGVSRAQLRWLVSAAAVIVAFFAAGAVSELLARAGVSAALVDAVIDAGLQLGLLAVPVAIAVAISRHGLFEIDRVVSRTVSYSVIVAVLAALYVGVVAAVAALLPARLGPLPVIAATLLVAALFLPLRRRVLRLVDQRFNRRRYDAERVLAGFTARLRAEPDRADIPQDLLEVLHRTVQPGHASIWLASTGAPTGASS